MSSNLGDISLFVCVKSLETLDLVKSFSQSKLEESLLLVKLQQSFVLRLNRGSFFDFLSKERVNVIWDGTQVVSRSDNDVVEFLVLIAREVENGSLRELAAESSHWSIIGDNISWVVGDHSDWTIGSNA